MNVYKRYVSGEHDKNFLEHNHCRKKGHIKLRPLSGQFDVMPNLLYNVRSLSHWLEIFPQAAFFTGFDPNLFGHVVTVVYKNRSTNKLSTVSITKFGCNIYENIILDSSSRFWPACENLTPSHRSSNVRKVLAITNLKNYNKLWNNRGNVEITRSWDETNAGSLASTMKLMEGYTPSELGERLLALGLLQTLNVASVLVDLVYDNVNGGEKVTAQNNALVSLLGVQMDQLFDPLLEYSPQAMDYVYKPPSETTAGCPLLSNLHINEVIKELLMVQTNFTMGLVNILQDLIIPLRVHFLSKPSEFVPGEININQAFPPTIDEVARINCVLHNSLKTAQTYGYSEVFKVLGTLIPYFYSAFVRHQANIRRYNLKYMKFLKHHQVFEDKIVNLKSYSPHQVESIISGSVFELPKLKLIIKRLYDVIISEQAKFEIAEPKTNNSELNVNFKTAIESIDALGFCDETDKPVKKRIFTPSGRLLVELAKGWPEELQYGWSNRKVLAVYEIQSSFSKEHEILIVFTDHLLFLDITSPEHGQDKLKLADILMNSLINKIPLPKLRYNPDLKVKYWCSIDRIIAKSFDSVNGKCMSFTTYGGNSFKLREQDKPTYSLVYDFLADTDAISTCNKIMTTITKAQILHKSTAFHLFKFTESDLNRFYCAHDKEEYKSEKMKSAVVILLNISKKEIEEIFAENPQVGMVLALSSLNDYTMHVFGYNRQRSYEVKEVVSIENLVDLLKEIIAKSLNSMFHSSFMTKELVLSGERLLEVFYTCQSLGSLDVKKPELPVKLYSSSSEETRGPRDSATEAFNLYSQYPIINSSCEDQSPKCEEPVQIIDSVQVSQTTPSKLKRKKSAVFSFFLMLKSKQKGPQFGSADFEYDNGSVNLNLPAGKQITYKRLYKPEPLLCEESREGTMIIDPALTQRDNINSMALLNQYPLLSVIEQYSMLKESGEVKEPNQDQDHSSLDINEEFEFPPSQDLRPARISKDFESPDIESEVILPKIDSEIVGQRANNIHDLNKDREQLNHEEHVSCMTFKTLLTPSGKKLKKAKKQATANSPAFAEKAIKFEKIRNVEEEDASPKDIQPTNADTLSTFKRITAIGVSPIVCKRFDRYQSLPYYLMTEDGQPNWTLLNGLSPEYATAISASTTSNSLKPELLKNRIFFELPNNPMAQYAFDDSFSVDAVARFLLERSELAEQLRHKKQIVESPSSSLIVSEFGRQLDKNFSSGLKIDDLTFTEHDDFDASTIYTDTQPLMSDATAGKSRISRTLSNASDDLLTSRLTDDFAACAIISSASSDMTLLNDILFENPLSQLSKSEDFGSLLYLSEVINGTVPIGIE